MRVLLTLPYSNNDIRDGLGFVSPPLGLGYIASYLREYGSHDIMLFDGMLHQTSDHGFAEVVSKYRPDVVGISAQATPAIYDVYRWAAVAKEANLDSTVVVGGAHASFSDAQILRDAPQIDFVVRGEGERVMLNLLEQIGTDNLDKVKGITYRTQLNIRRNPLPPHITDLDSIPFPAYDLMEMNLYLQGPIRVGTMISSRGCPYKCTFCSSSRSSGKKWRGRSADNVISEMELLIKRYKIKALEFLDDLFCYDPLRVKRICDLIGTRDISIDWTCSVRADILSSNPLMAEWLKKAGCHSVYMGVESGRQRVLDLMCKGTTLQQIWRANEIAKEAKLERILSFIFGFPSETIEEAASTLEFACRLNPEIAQFTICTPYPGTPLFETAKKQGILRADSWKDYSVMKPVMQLKTISEKKLRKLLHQAYLRFYLRPSFIWSQIKSKNTFFLRKILEGIRVYLRRRAMHGQEERISTHEDLIRRNFSPYTDAHRMDFLSYASKSETA